MHNSLKEQVLQSLDIVEIVGERVALTRKGKDYMGLCPFHPDHKPSLAVSPKKQIFKCWSCGAGGDVIKFVQMRDRVEFREALQILARRAGLDARGAAEDPRAAQLREQIRAAVAWAAGHFQRNLQQHPAGRAALEYAHARGLVNETIERHGLGLAPDGWDDLCNAARRAGHSAEVLQQAGLIVTNEQGRSYDRFRNRLIFPIRDTLGRPIAFGGRTLGDDPAKYLNSPETVLFSKSRVLYALDLARKPIETEKVVVVVEGYMDAVLLHQHGFANVVATLGTALTDSHVKLLKPLTDRILLCFDGDEAGMKAADRAVEVALRTRADVRVVVLPAGIDPADCVQQSGSAAFAAFLSDAVDALQFKWQQTIKKFGGGGPRIGRAAVEEYLQFVAAVTAAGGIDPLEQGLLIRRLGDLLSVPPESVFELLARAKLTRRHDAAPGAAAEDESTYVLSVRGLPEGLVGAVEDLLGMLLEGRPCWAWLDDTLSAALVQSPTWVRLYELCLHVSEEQSEYSRQDVIMKCDEADLLDLISRARERAAGAEASEARFRAAQQRLKAELELLSMEDLRRKLAQPGAPEEAFRSLQDVARRQDSVLAAEARWAAPR